MAWSSLSLSGGSRSCCIMKDIYSVHSPPLLADRLTVALLAGQSWTHHALLFVVLKASRGHRSLLYPLRPLSYLPILRRSIADDGTRLGRMRPAASGRVGGWGSEGRNRERRLTYYTKREALEWLRIARSTVLHAPEPLNSEQKAEQEPNGKKEGSSIHSAYRSHNICNIHKPI